MMMEAIDWPSVFSGPQSYNPAAIPIFFRMGRVKHNRPNFGLRLKAVGNLDLMKVKFCLVMYIRRKIHQDNIIWFAVISPMSTIKTPGFSILNFGKKYVFGKK